MSDPITISVIKVHQNKGDFYVGVMQARDLFDVAAADRMRLEELEVPKYAGIQRPLVEARVRSIREYLKEPKSNFPNSIVVSLNSRYISSWDNSTNGLGVSTLTIDREKEAMEIIDGQHRAAAFDAADDEFQVIVSIFVDLEKKDCAEIFAKINSTQRQVNASIAYQLFGYSPHRSPQRTAHEIALKLNATIGSPFYRGLHMMGTKDQWSQKGYLSQSAFCNGLMRLYSKKPERDQNRLARGLPLEVYSEYPLRLWFVEGKDAMILKAVWTFFHHVATTWEQQWKDDPGYSVLRKTTGYCGFIEVLRLWLVAWSERKGFPLDETTLEAALKEFGNALINIKAKYEEPDHKFIKENYPPGNHGVIALRNSLSVDLDLKEG